MKTSVMLVFLLSACSTGVLDPHGPVGGAERTILFDATVIMLAVIVPVIVATGAFAWWFRAGNRKAHRQPEWSYAGRIEFVVWSIPTLVVLFLGGIGWISSHDLDPRTPLHSRTAPLEVDVVSLDWKWLFIYPALHVASINRLVRAGRCAAALSPDLGRRHEQFLRTAARQSDLHHGRHGHRIEFAGRRCGHLRRTVRTI